jgi:hypothetical protein
MMQNGFILNKKYCWYIVVCKENGNAYYEKVEIDHSYFWNEIYPRGDKFHSTKIEPLMKRYNLKRIMPPSSSFISDVNSSVKDNFNSEREVVQTNCDLTEYKNAREEENQKKLANNTQVIESAIRKYIKI